MTLYGVWLCGFGLVVVVLRIIASRARAAFPEFINRRFAGTESA